MPHPGPSQDEPIDFDAPAAEPTGSVACAACKRSIADEYWTVGDAVLCRSCKATVESGQKVPAGIAFRAGRLGRATLYGGAGMLGGAAIWYAIAKFANLEIGLIAILLGWMVGKAVFLGSGKRGGLRYQILAAALTYLGIGVAYAPFAYEGMRADWAADSIPAVSDTLSKQTEAFPDSATTLGALADTAVLPAPHDSATEAEAGQTAPEPIQLGMAGVLLGIGAILVMVLAIPVVIIAETFPGSLISLLIYGFAIVQAWQMTGPARIGFAGPFKVGGAASE